MSTPVPPPPRRASDPPAADHTSDRAADLEELLGLVRATQGKPWGERFFVIGLSLLLTGGGGTALFTLAEDWIKRPPAEVMEELRELRDDLDALQKEVEGTAAVARETLEIVDAAHPSRGRVGVPNPDPK